jgi:site-specific recombinase XerD
MAVTVNLTLLKRKKLTNGTIPIYIRITENRKSRYISTGITVKESDWNKRQQEIRKSHPLSVKLNDELTKLKLKAEEAKSELRQQERLDAKTLKKELETNKNVTIEEFYETYRDLLEAQDRYWEFKKIQDVFNDISRFGHSDTVVNQIDLKFLEEFRDFLFHKRGNGTNTVRKKMQRFKGLVSEARKQKLIKDDPYLDFPTIKRVKNPKTKLPFSQIKDIEALKLERNSNLWHTRNYFLFSLYTAGMRFSDVCALMPNNLVDGRVKYVTNKTEKSLSIKLSAQALNILQHYNTEDMNAYVFPILDKVYDDPFLFRKKANSKNVLINKWIKKIAKLAGIQEKVTFHVARHSYSHHALKRGMDHYSLSKSLGHSDLKTTEIYIKSFDQEMIDQAMDTVFSEE